MTTTASHDAPILMSAPMIVAILNGAKTVTRRIVNLDTLRVRLRDYVSSDERVMGLGVPRVTAKPGAYPARLNQHGAVTIKNLELGVKPGEFDFVCPYAIGETNLVDFRDARGKRWVITPRDSVLWVKENWCSAKSLDALAPAAIGDAARAAGYDAPWAPVRYAADDATNGELASRFGSGDTWGRTRNLLHMPRWASRLRLRVSTVRLEHLHDITEEDAQLEGASPSITYRKVYPSSQAAEVEVKSYRDGYAKLWRAINGEDSWNNNAWVWRIEFARSNER